MVHLMSSNSHLFVWYICTPPMHRTHEITCNNLSKWLLLRVAKSNQRINSRTSPPPTLSSIHKEYAPHVDSCTSNHMLLTIYVGGCKGFLYISFCSICSLMSFCFHVFPCVPMLACPALCQSDWLRFSTTANQKLYKDHPNLILSTTSFPCALWEMKTNIMSFIQFYKHYYHWEGF